MTPTETFWLIIGIALIPYSFVGGTVGVLAYQIMLKKSVGYSGDRTGFGIFAGVLWPFALPTIAGMLTATHYRNHEQRGTIKHDRKMAQLKAQKELKQLDIKNAKLNIFYLEEAGIKANVPGLYEGAAK